MRVNKKAPQHPTILVKLTPAGLKVSLMDWQHNAPVTLLAGLEVAVQRAVHEWRGKFLAQGMEFGTPNLRERDLVDERQAEQRRKS